MYTRPRTLVVCERYSMDFAPRRINSAVGWRTLKALRSWGMFCGIYYGIARTPQAPESRVKGPISCCLLLRAPGTLSISCKSITDRLLSPLLEARP